MILLQKKNNINPGTGTNYSEVNKLATLAINQDDAAASCNQSPVAQRLVSLSYTNTLIIQHELAIVCPSQSTRVIFLSRPFWLSIDSVVCIVDVDSGCVNKSNTPGHSMKGHPKTSPKNDRWKRNLQQEDPMTLQQILRQFQIAVDI